MKTKIEENVDYTREEGRKLENRRKREIRKFEVKPLGKQPEKLKAIQKQVGGTVLMYSGVIFFITPEYPSDWYTVCQRTI